MSETERPTCKTCPYWNTEFNELDDGYFAPDSDIPAKECRRYAPIRAIIDSYRGSGRDSQASEMLKRELGRHTEWLRTAEDDWCGEHPDFPAYIESLKKS